MNLKLIRELYDVYLRMADGELTDYMLTGDPWFRRRALEYTSKAEEVGHILSSSIQIS